MRNEIHIEPVMAAEIHRPGCLASRGSFWGMMLLMAASMLAVCQSSTAQEKPSANPASAEDQEIAETNSQIADLEVRFYRLQEDFRKHVVEAQNIGIRYLNSPTLEEADPYVEEFDANLELGNKILEKWIPVGEELFELKHRRGIAPNDDLIPFMSKLLEKRYDDNQFESAYTISKRLMKLFPQDARARFFFAKSAMMTNRFGTDVSATLESFKEHFQKEGAVKEAEHLMIANIFYLDEEFKKEKVIREKEAEANDLPRVKFETTKGDVVFELFENEAPEAVANFISLVESNHFDGLIFDTVIDKTAAQTGKLDENYEVRNIGYTIKDEYRRPDARKIFAGSLVMYSIEPDSGDSLFFVSLASLVNLHGKQTVFGRVYSGLENIHAFNKTFTIDEDKQIPIEGAVADKVLKATVLRKRDHDYTPNKITK